MICLFHKKNKVGKGAHEPKIHTAGAYIPVSVTRSKPRSIATLPWMGYYSIAGLLPSSMFEGRLALNLGLNLTPVPFSCVQKYFL